MKLVLKQYLASLKERSELDAILPDLLSEMGLNVFIAPTRGVKEYGVDIAAVGSIKGDEEKVYLFSVKGGNLTRSTWSGSTDQALRPSLDEIRDGFIRSRLPPAHSDKPIVICLCFGGDVNSGIRQEVSGYQQRNTEGKISFEEWNGDKLSELILEYLLKEEILPKNWQSMLRKSLALLDEAQASHTHFQQLVRALLKSCNSADSTYISVNRINLCLWVLFSWCREENNLESAYLSAEFALLESWDKVKDQISKKTINAYENLLETYRTITDEYLDKCVIPYSGKQHAISSAISTPCAIDINLKLFDLLGRLSMGGLWVLESLKKTCVGSQGQDESEEEQALRERLDVITSSVKQLIINNPLLLSPYKDSQAVDVGLSLYLLSQNSKHDEFVVSWLIALVDRCEFTFKTNGMYPTILGTYEELLEHRDKDKSDKEYKKRVTNGSVLYPLLCLYGALYKVDKASAKLEIFANEELGDCTLQYWYPNINTEESIYSNTDMHGFVTTSFPMKGPEAISHVLAECEADDFFSSLSAIENGFFTANL